MQKQRLTCPPGGQSESRTCSSRLFNSERRGSPSGPGEVMGVLEEAGVGFRSNGRCFRCFLVQLIPRVCPWKGLGSQNKFRGTWRMWKWPLGWFQRSMKSFQGLSKKLSGLLRRLNKPVKMFLEPLRRHEGYWKCFWGSFKGVWSAWKGKGFSSVMFQFLCFCLHVSLRSGLLWPFLIIPPVLK